jgi:hypothetical protein
VEEFATAVEVEATMVPATALTLPTGLVKECEMVTETQERIREELVLKSGVLEVQDVEEQGLRFLQ